jgi:hypothetical protein
MPEAQTSASYPDDRLRAAVREEANRKFVDAWLAWRGSGRLMPRLGAMEIADIKELLGSVMLFEMTGPDEIRIKVAGTRLRDHASFEPTGRSYIELTPPGLWPTRRYRMHSMAAWPCAGAMTTLDRQTVGGGMQVETVTLPIDADQPGAPRLLISCLAAVGGDYRPPLPGRPPLIALADHFAFIDIGAGTPVRTEP